MVDRPFCLMLLCRLIYVNPPLPQGSCKSLLLITLTPHPFSHSTLTSVLDVANLPDGPVQHFLVCTWAHVGPMSYKLLLLLILGRHPVRNGVLPSAIQSKNIH